MQKFLQFFLIGLLVGAFVLWAVQRDLSHNVQMSALREEIDSLKWLYSSESITRSYHTSDDPVSMPDIQSDISLTRENAITRAIATTSDAVVGISVEQVTEVVNPYVPRDPLFRMFLDEKYWPRTIQQQASSLGSGFIVTQDGYIVTNEHVVRNATSIAVTTTAGKKYQAKIVGTDELLDMALIKIEDKGLPFIEWANSDEAIVGEWVVAIGNPYGLFDVNDQPSVAVGVISALNRDFERDVDGRLYTDMIQTDAAINRGNSGGPLVDAEGRAVGMNTLIFTESGGSVGIGFAIPSNRILKAIDDLVKGGVDRNFWLGIRANDLRGMLWKMLDLAENRGAVVTGVDPGSPADRAGIKVEDVILKINNRDINRSEDAKQFMDNTDIRVGDKLSFVISRHGKIMTKEVELIPIPKARSYIPG